MCRFDPGGSIGMSAGGFTAGIMWFTNSTQNVGPPTINSVQCMFVVVVVVVVFAILTPHIAPYRLLSRELCVHTPGLRKVPYLQKIRGGLQALPMC